MVESTCSIPEGFMQYLLHDGKCGSLEEVKCRCEVCGQEYVNTLKAAVRKFRKNGGSFCPHCSRSRGRVKFNDGLDPEAKELMYKKRSTANKLKRPTIAEFYHLTDEDIATVAEEYRDMLYSKDTQANDKVEFVCHEHGRYMQRIGDHFHKGAGCPKCARVRTLEGVKTRLKHRGSPIEHFGIAEDKLRDVHPDDLGKLYDETTPVWDKVRFICPIHGEYEQSISNHFGSGAGCPVCGRGVKAASLREYYKITEEQLAEVHPDDVCYLEGCGTATTKIRFICKEHGEYIQQIDKHFRNGQGCPDCKPEYVYHGSNPEQCSLTKITKRGNAAQFYGCPEKVADVHPDDVPLLDTAPVNTKIRFVCPKHGIYYQTIFGHFGDGNGCPSCVKANGTFGSELETRLCNTLVALGLHAFKSVIPATRLELDIYIPEHKLAIEVNGHFWHSDKWIDSKPHAHPYTGRTYHKYKTDLCRKAGIRLIHFHYWELAHKWDICMSKILSVCGKLVRERVMARKCEVRILTRDEAKMFLDAHHIQGDAGGETYGLIYGGEIMSCMGWRKSSSRSGDWELNRYASHPGYFVAGGFGKLEKAFLRDHPECRRIVSFAELRLSDGGMYEHEGYRLDGVVPPSYSVCTPDGEPHHKFNFRKDRFKRSGEYVYEEGMTEYELEDINGLTRVWDCGKLRYVKDIAAGNV